MGRRWLPANDQVRPVHIIETRVVEPIYHAIWIPMGDGGAYWPSQPWPTLKARCGISFNAYDATNLPECYASRFARPCKRCFRDG